MRRTLQPKGRVPARAPVLGPRSMSVLVPPASHSDGRSQATSLRTGGSGRTRDMISFASSVSSAPCARRMSRRMRIGLVAQRVQDSGRACAGRCRAPRRAPAAARASLVSVRQVGKRRRAAAHHRSPARSSTRVRASAISSRAVCSSSTLNDGRHAGLERESATAGSGRRRGWSGSSVRPAFRAPWRTAGALSSVLPVRQDRRRWL